MTRPNVIGVLLTGGASSRMGRDKADLDWFGTPLRQHMADCLRAAGCRQVLHAGSAGCPDHRPGLGPLAGILAAARQAPGQALLVCPVDMPLLGTELLQALAEQPGACCYQEHVLPCRIPARADLPELLEQLLADPQPRNRNLRALLQRLDSHELPCAQPERLLNTNTPEQYQHCLALARRLNRGEA
ncbi:molybdenum cofactor guanylyltransferase [Azomonas macrocytogenes]|uniref:Molybdopterin-guanine dinucleotide biosynthesis protein A n=1 Tax=Azomonas macrocytogenes TaxID=69962 RepID=A0A839SXX0_AZOMA|nr:molybdenum cofactor guanylyltransferase [Azomonas macrocytogenes]MBB3101962.1 molybdopterin-guanine dinucleotide biosynthesis protein A [Azomonas macrocytogenes]